MLGPLFLQHQLLHLLFSVYEMIIWLLEMFLGKKVQIKKSGVGGRLWVEFESRNDLEDLAKKILK